METTVIKGFLTVRQWDLIGATLLAVNNVNKIGSLIRMTISDDLSDASLIAGILWLLSSSIGVYKTHCFRLKTTTWMQLLNTLMDAYVLIFLLVMYGTEDGPTIWMF